MIDFETSVSRRSFIKVSAALGGGLLIAVYGCDTHRSAPGTQSSRFEPNAFVQIDTDGNVLVLSKHLEMGQGVYTGLATIIADELDADWSKVRVEGAPADERKYANLAFGPQQGTGGSSGIANSWDQHRKAGATARAMLVAAAAAQWNVPVSELNTEPGVVVHAASNRRATYGTLVAAASKLAVPEAVSLKNPTQFRYIGKEKVTPRVDAVAKSNGQATFTQDVKLPGMLTAVVAHAPLFGARVDSFDATKAKAIPGVTDVVRIPTGVAVLATTFWAARQGRDALAIQWNTVGANTMGSAEVMAQFRSLAETPGIEIRNDGDVGAALSASAKTVNATYEFPYLAHAAMEPLNCVVRLGTSSAEVWNGNQFHTVDQAAVAKVFGFAPAQVAMHTVFAGGSFGRRANAKSDYVVEAAEIAKAIAGRAPVKLVWTREDDMSAGYFRPAFLHRISGGIDASGKLVAWQHRVVGQSVLEGSVFAPTDGKDSASYEGASDHPYTVENMHLDAHFPRIGIPVQWWRSVGHTHTAFAVEMFVDELAHAAGIDPLAFRRALLTSDPRRLHVLNIAADLAGWGTPLAAGHARGLAVHKSFGTYVAEVAEVSLVDGAPQVHRVVCAVDCGIVVNPDIVRAQMEGSIAFGLSAALYGEIKIDAGRVVTTNFDTYRVLRQREMPKVEVHIIHSTEPPTGVGEPGTPPIGPAVANALFALTGKPVRRAPLAS
jgi:isoquinoline 1-oxidoreductase subunit beta